MHISDLHAGWPFRLELAEQVAREAHALRPDLVVISGDFVQRADFAVQWRVARGYLASLPQPQLVVPGNHDVPLVNVVNRLVNPLAQYRRNISPDLNPVFERPGLVVVGGCSAHGLTVDGGKVSRGGLGRQRRHFQFFLRRRRGGRDGRRLRLAHRTGFDGLVHSRQDARALLGSGCRLAIACCCGRRCFRRGRLGSRFFRGRRGCLRSRCFGGSGRFRSRLARGSGPHFRAGCRKDLLHAHSLAAGRIFSPPGRAAGRRAADLCSFRRSFR